MKIPLRCRLLWSDLQRNSGTDRKNEIQYGIRPSGDRANDGSYAIMGQRDVLAVFSSKTAVDAVD